MANDLRRYAKQTNSRLILGGIIILFVLGDGLIYIFYGGGAALMGLACIFAGLVPLILVWLALVGLEWFSRWANKE
jgi:hypothetical protein